jgi:bifunctional NMN adenylyltransferase/nudix hydrolase
MPDKNVSVFIGRFQPFHSAHREVAIKSLDESDQLVFVIGGDLAPRTIKNPFTVEERIEIIKLSLPEYLDRLHFISIRDYLYNDNVWATQVVNKINQYVGKNKITLIGSEKDESSYYLKMFPQWKHNFIRPIRNVDATTIRKYLFENIPTSNISNLDYKVAEYLNNFTSSSHFQELVTEYNYIKQYKESWSNTPYPVSFQTVDSVVFKSAHVLVVVRKIPPGKGLYALPGGFLDPKETLLKGAVRELYEETNILFPRNTIMDKIIEQRVFDHPDRSLRGRTITTAFNFDLGLGELPSVTGNDDAEKALWMPFDEVSRNLHMFFEDHAHIIEYFMYKQGAK